MTKHDKTTTASTTTAHKPAPKLKFRTAVRAGGDLDHGPRRRGGA